MNLEIILQIFTIISFIAGAIKIGEVKTNIQKDVEKTQKDVEQIRKDFDEQQAEFKEYKKEHKKEIDELYRDMEKLRNENSQNTTRVETLLIEVKTKLNLLMQVSGIFKPDNE